MSEEFRAVPSMRWTPCGSGTSVLQPQGAGFCSNLHELGNRFFPEPPEPWLKPCETLSRDWARHVWNSDLGTMKLRDKSCCKWRSLCYFVEQQGKLPPLWKEWFSFFNFFFIQFCSLDNFYDLSSSLLIFLSYLFFYNFFILDFFSA